MHSGDPEIVFERLTSSHVPALHRMLETFVSEPAAKYFTPHSFELAALRRLAAHHGDDLYFLAFLQHPAENRALCGYGILRGWEEGFNVPSLGIVIHRDYRAIGLGRKFMLFLHSAAREKGANNVRLTVDAGNENALALYRSLGYQFETMPNSSRLVGVAPLV